VRLAWIYGRLNLKCRDEIFESKVSIFRGGEDAFWVIAHRSSYGLIHAQQGEPHECALLSSRLLGGVTCIHFTIKFSKRGSGCILQSILDGATNSLTSYQITLIRSLQIQTSLPTLVWVTSAAAVCTLNLTSLLRLLLVCAKLLLARSPTTWGK
jgi:hypothetical protein